MRRVVEETQVTESALRSGGGSDTSWIDPDPPPIPDRILRKVEPEQSTRRGRARKRMDELVRRYGRRRHALLIGVVAVAVAVVLLWPQPTFGPAEQARWQRLCLEYAAWFGPLVERLTPDDRLALREQGFDGVLADFDSARKTLDPRLIAGLATPETLQGNPSIQGRAFLHELAEQAPPAARTQAGVAATGVSLGTLERVAATFERWPAAVSLAGHGALFEQQQWQAAAVEVKAALADLPPAALAPLAPALRRVASDVALTREAVAAFDRLQKHLMVLKTVDDPVLAALAEQVAALSSVPDAAAPPAGVEASPSAQQTLEQLTARLQSLDAFGQRLAEAVQDGRWAAVEQAHFQKNGQAYALLSGDGPVTDDVFRLWLEELPRFTSAGEDWRELWVAEQRARLRGVEDQLAELRAAAHPTAKPMGLRWHRLDERIAQTLEGPFIAGTAGAMDIERQSIEQELADLERLAKQIRATPR